VKHFVATRMEKRKNFESQLTLSAVFALGLERSVLNQRGICNNRRVSLLLSLSLVLVSDNVYDYVRLAFVRDRSACMQLVVTVVDV
jgi:hypothetical protein